LPGDYNLDKWAAWIQDVTNPLDTDEQVGHALQVAPPSWWPHCWSPTQLGPDAIHDHGDKENRNVVNCRILIINR
jgi:hypothetical protein